jgi:hypothetical protein
MVTLEMSAASDVTTLRQIVAQYSVGAAAQHAWSTSQPISTSGVVTGGSVYSGGSVTAMGGLSLPTTHVGTVTLASGTATVTIPACKTTSFIFLTNKTASNQGFLRVVPGTGSAVITSSNGSDASVVQWMLINPA